MDIQGVSVAENTVRGSVCERTAWPRHLFAVIDTDATPYLFVDPIIVEGATETMESEKRSTSERIVEVPESP